MTLYEIVSTLKAIALTQVSVKTAEDGNIYDLLNVDGGRRYGEFVITQNSHRETENFDYYGLTLFYVDRLEDNMENNRLQIQSIGKEVLSNIINTFVNNFDAEKNDIIYTPFTQKFADECAGVWCSAEFEVPKDVVCPEFYNNTYVPSEEEPHIVIRNQAKSVTITENGTIRVTYDEGYTGLENVDITVNVPQSTTMGGEYLYEADYEDLDYEYAYGYFNDLKEVNVGGCSAIRKGNLVGRNLDWKDDYEVNIVVRYANTIGVAGGLSSLTVQQMNEGITEQQRKIIPFYLQDGFNDDLFAEMNVVPFNGCSKTVVSDPTDSVCALMLVRYIIDHYTNIEDAIDGLSNTEIWLPQRLIEMGFGLHFMLADAERTVVLEIADNELKVVDSEISTNFEINGVTFRAGGGVWTPADAPTHTATSQGIADYGTGLERWNILNARNILNKDGMFAALDAVAFSKAYTTPWYDEFVGGDITVDTPITDPAFEARIAEYQARWEAHTKESADCWITCHSCVYDLENKVLYVRSQENGAENVYRNNYAEVWDYGYESGIAEQKEKLTDLTVSINGTYEREDGYNRVVVNVPQGEDYEEGYQDGLADGEAAQKARLATTAFTQNGTYTRADGWKEVVVNTNPQGEEISSNYNISLDEYGRYWFDYSSATTASSITITFVGVEPYNGYCLMRVAVPADGQYKVINSVSGVAKMTVDYGRIDTNDVISLTRGEHTIGFFFTDNKIPDNAFYGFDTSIYTQISVLGNNNLIYVGKNAYRDIQGLGSIDIRNIVADEYAFANTGGDYIAFYNEITIDNTTFLNNSNLSWISCNTNTPPFHNDYDVFNGCESGGHIGIPRGTMSDYLNEPWVQYLLNNHNWRIEEGD